MWVYGNPWSQTEPKYLKTGGQLTKLPDTPLKTSSLSNIVLGKKIESQPVETESAKVRSEEEVASINEKVDNKEIKLKKKTNFSKNLNSSKQKIINTSTSNLNPEVSKSDANESLKDADNVEQIESYDEKDKNNESTTGINDEASHASDEQKNLTNNVEETSGVSKELESRDENDEDANDSQTNDDPTETSSHADSEQEENDNKSEEIKLIEDDLHISDAEDQSNDEEEKEGEDVQKNGEDNEEASVLTPQTNPKGLYNESDKVFEERNDILTLLEDSHGLDLTLQSQHSFDSAVDKFVSNVATKSMKDVNENLVDFNSFNWKPDVEFFKFSQGQSDSGVFTFDQSVAAPFSSQVSRKSGHLRERLKMKRK